MIPPYGLKTIKINFLRVRLVNNFINNKSRVHDFD